MAKRDRRLTVQDTSDPDQVETSQRLSDDREGDLLSVLKDPRGRRWLSDLVFVLCHINVRSYVPHDATQTAFNEGARSVGLAVWEQVLSKHPEWATKLIEEQTDG